MQKTSNKEYRVETVNKIQGNKLYVKWKVYDNRFNNWVNKKDIVWKWVNTFLSRLEVVLKVLMLKLIFQIM